MSAPTTQLTDDELHAYMVKWAKGFLSNGIPADQISGMVSTIAISHQQGKISLAPMQQQEEYGEIPF